MHKGMKSNKKGKYVNKSKWNNCELKFLKELEHVKT